MHYFFHTKSVISLLMMNDGGFCANVLGIYLICVSCMIIFSLNKLFYGGKIWKRLKFLSFSYEFLKNASQRLDKILVLFVYIKCII